MERRLVLLGMLLAACGQAAETPKPQVVPERLLEIHHMENGKATLERLKVGIADDDPKREMGLMYRKEMPQDAGMLFVWNEAEERTFWMHNTYLPLDLMFIRSGKIVRIIPWAKPHDDSPLPSGEPADMVLEVNGGWTQKRGVETGDTVKLP